MQYGLPICHLLSRTRRTSMPFCHMEWNNSLNVNCLFITVGSRNEVGSHLRGQQSSLQFIILASPREQQR